MQCIKINHKLNANSKKEQMRLKKDFPKDDDIFICRKGSSSACYVKNCLQPTRSFGDLRLKSLEFNNPNNYSTEFGFPKRIQNFNGPYINHIPDIKVFELQKEDRFLVLGSDGLWDELNKNDVGRIVKANHKDKNKIAQE